MIKRKIISSIIIIIIFNSFIYSQEQKLVKTFKADEVAFLPELGAIISYEEGKLKVSFVPPVETREKEYKDVDLKQGDEISFVNGKSVKSLKDFRDIYSKIKVKENVKLAVKRNNERMFVEYPRMDESNMKNKRIIIRSDTKSDVNNVKTFKFKSKDSVKVKAE